MNNEFTIKCDTPKCGFEVKSKDIPKRVPLKRFINVPCPKCDNVLLTEQDFLHAQNFASVMNVLTPLYKIKNLFSAKKNDNKSSIQFINGAIIIKERNEN